MSQETTSPAEPGGPVITISSLAKVRPLFTFNPGTPEEEHFEFRLLEFDFGVDEEAEHMADGDEFNELWSKPGRKVCKDTGAVAVDGVCPEHEKAACLRRDKLTVADKKRMKELLDRMFGRCLVRADELQGRLTDGQKREVVGTFQYAPRLAEMLAAQQNAKAEKDAETTGSPPTTGS